LRQNSFFKKLNDETLIIDDDIYIIKDYHLIFVKSIQSIILSDLHLGYENVAAKNGVFLPKLNLNHIIEQIDNFVLKIGKNNINNIIVLGDIKNEFDEVDQAEIDELFSFVHHIRTTLFDKDVNILLVKGNHDNYVDGYALSLNVKVFRQELLLGKYLLFHGEDIPNQKLYDACDFLIMAHEHPAIVLFTEIGERVKTKCFLFGNFDKKILILPAISYYAQGTDINLLPKEELLSPFLKTIDIDELIPIIVDSDLFIFPKIKYLRY
jgi:putative phosphoesterase, SbcD/Mre11-related